MTTLTRLFGVPGSFQRRYAMATALFAVLILCIILLFGHLISGSLSRRYLDDLLLSGRHQAEQIADQIDGEAESVVELQGISKKREELFRTLEGVAQREIVEMVEVVDKDGTVVFTSEFRSTEQIPEADALHLELKGTLTDRDWQETENRFTIAVPIGQVGEVVLHLRRAELVERVERLRKELLTRTWLLAGMTILTLITAFVLIWVLIQRTARLESRHREARELAALGTLAANLAHEIRNPLNSINLNLELVEEDLRDGINESAAASLVDTRGEVNRLGRMVTDFLTYARPTKPVFGPIDVGGLVRNVREFLAAEARQDKVHLRLGAIPAQAEVKGDEGQMRQVIMNLVLNALQAVQDLDPERRVVELEVVAGDESVEVVVRDRGPGIAESEFERIREAFYTQRRGGSGLGLAIAERVVRMHGGELNFFNLEPFGFEARVWLARPPD